MIFLPGVNRCICPACLWRSLWYKKPTTMQERWDEQIAVNLTASHFGRERETRMIGARMRWCPNNPRNGGDGFDTRDGKWRDLRWTPENRGTPLWVAHHDMKTNRERT